MLTAPDAMPSTCKPWRDGNTNECNPLCSSKPKKWVAAQRLGRLALLSTHTSVTRAAALWDLVSSMQLNPRAKSMELNPRGVGPRPFGIGACHWSLFNLRHRLQNDEMAYTLQSLYFPHLEPPQVQKCRSICTGVSVSWMPEFAVGQWHCSAGRPGWPDFRFTLATYCIPQMYNE